MDLAYYCIGIHWIWLIIVLGLLLYLRFCHGLTKGEIVRVMCFSIFKPCQIIIEDQIEDTKFAQEKFKKSAFSTLFQHVPR